MIILAIDPGPVKSAWVKYATADGEIIAKDFCPNDELLRVIEEFQTQFVLCPPIVVEMIKSYGMPVGDDVFVTCLWIGRFIERWRGPFVLLPRKTIVAEICGRVTGKDANVRQALINRFSNASTNGGGKTPAIGTKKKPGPLYGFKEDLWAALAVAVAWADREERDLSFLE